MQAVATLDEILRRARQSGKAVDRKTAAFTLGFLAGQQLAAKQRVGRGRTVCVTGASGFVASHCVQQLLEAGYTVHGTVRSLTNPDKVRHLTSLFGASERLKLFEADLLKEGSFDEAVAGCEAVLHTASPFTSDKTMTEDDFCKPAIQGTLNVLGSLKRNGVKICVITSSTAAVYCYTEGGGDDHVYGDDDWSDASKLRENKVWYSLSKTLAERAAHEFAAANGIALKSCNPTYILGPRLQSGVNESTSGILKYLNGTNKQIRYGSKCIVDVRDVARAHILCYRKVLKDGAASFGNRVVLIAACPTWAEIVAQVEAAVPESHVSKVHIPSEIAEKGTPLAIPFHIKYKCATASAIGLTFTPWKETVSATVQSIVAWGNLD